MDEIDNLDFNKIDKLYDSYNTNQNKVENIILQNDFIEQYNYKEFEIKNENKKDNGNNDNDNEEENVEDIMNINTLGHDSESANLENKNKKIIIDGILNMNEKNKDNAIKYIQNLIKNENKNS